MNVSLLSRLRRWGALFLTVLLLTAAACNGISLRSDSNNDSDSPSDIGITPTPEVEPEEGGSLIVAIPEEPSSLNFTLNTSPSAHWILSTLDARMIRITADNEYQPHLLREVPTLENGGISEDGLTYTIRFLPDITWSDGEPVDARDFAFTWQTITDEDYPAVHQRGWSLIEDVTVSNDNLSAVIRLHSPSAGFTDRVLAGGSGNSAGFLLPRHRLEDIPPEELATHEYGAEEHVGTGPFQIGEWEPGEQLTVERNDAYFGEPPLLDRIVFRFTESSRDAAALVTTGDVDVSVNLPETALLDAIESEETESIITPRAGAVKTYAFNLNDPEDLTQPHPIFEDIQVRKAVVMGFDRWNVVEMLLLDQTEVPGTLLSNTLWENERVTPIPYNPEQAVDLLEQAGWVPGDDGIRARGSQRLSFTVTTTAGDDPDAVLRQRVQEAFIEDMQELGIEVEPVNYEPEQLFGTDEQPGILAQRNFDLIDLPWEDRFTLDKFIERVSELFIPTPEYPDGGNLMGYTNPEISRLLRDQAVTLDPEKRAELLNEVQQLFMEDIPVVLIYDHFEIDIMRNYVHGLDPGPVSGLWWNVEEWWISPDEVVIN